MERIYFTVKGTPQGKARARTVRDRSGRVHSFTPKKTADYEKRIRLACKESMTGEPMEGPLNVRISAYFEIPKSYTKKRKLDIYEGREYPTKKPDVDNIVKAVLDGLNGTAYKDDCQVVRLWVSKAYTDDEPRVVVGIYHLEDDEDD